VRIRGEGGVDRRARPRAGRRAEYREALCIETVQTDVDAPNRPSRRSSAAYFGSNTPLVVSENVVDAAGPAQHADEIAQP